MTDQKTLSELCARIDALDKAATKGPWQKSAGQIIQTNHITRDVWVMPRNDHDLDLVAEYRSLAPQIAKRAMRMERQLEIAMRALKIYRDMFQTAVWAEKAIDKIAALEGGGD